MRTTNEQNKTTVGAGPVSAQKGITLIALVITIIVMLILVAVTISMAVNGGLFEYARKAGTQTNAAVEAEQELANLEEDMTVDQLIDKYTGGGSGNELPVYASAKFDKGVLAENATFSSDGYTAVIPKGFKIINGLEGTQSIAAGLVIQDATGNEFVWIPVKYEKAGDENVAEKKLDSNFLNVFRRSNVDDTDYSEPYASGYSDGNGTQEKADYYNMMKSVQDNYGFYVGRYEAGTTEKREYDFDNETDTLVVKRDAMPYNYVAWGKSMRDYKSIIKFDFDKFYYSETGKNQGKGAVLLSKELYGKTEDAGKYGVVSTLCYGVQWDAMLKFMEKDIETDSSGWGNYADNNLKITRTSAKYYANGQWNPVTETSCGKLLTTGADDSFAVKNIFDVAGNCWEWTMEANSTGYRVYRGGGYNVDGDVDPASNRSSISPSSCDASDSFRAALYITNE